LPGAGLESTAFSTYPLHRPNYFVTPRGDSRRIRALRYSHAREEKSWFDLD
jgi:hypothetical protein